MRAIRRTSGSRAVEMNDRALIRVGAAGTILAAPISPARRRRITGKTSSHERLLRILLISDQGCGGFHFRDAAKLHRAAWRDVSGLVSGDIANGSGSLAGHGRLRPCA